MPQGHYRLAAILFERHGHQQLRRPVPLHTAVRRRKRRPQALRLISRTPHLPKSCRPIGRSRGDVFHPGGPLFPSLVPISRNKRTWREAKSPLVIKMMPKEELESRRVSPPPPPEEVFFTGFAVRSDSPSTSGHSSLPRTSFMTDARSRNAFSPSPRKEDPCMIASVLGFRPPNSPIRRSVLTA